MKSALIILLCLSLTLPARAVTDGELNSLIEQIEILHEQKAPVEEQLRLEQLYFQKLDQAIKDKMEIYVTESLETVRKNPTVSPDKITQLEQLRDSFEASVALYGTPKDFQRFNAFYEYHRALKRTLAENQSFKPSFRERMQKLLITIKNGLRVLAPFIKLSFYTIFPELRDTKGTPLTKAADEFFTKTALNQKATVELEGTQHIRQDLPAKEINIILSNHVNADNDAIVLSQLGLKSYVTFGALNLKGEGIFSIATHSLFKGVLKRIDMQRDIILLGRGNDPLARLIDVLNSGRTQNLFLFPQGMISLGFDETNPLKPQFSEKVIKQLQDAGFKINLHVMSMPDNFEDTLSLEKTETRQSKVLRAKVSEAISDEQVRSLFRERGGAGVDFYLRGQWIRDLRQYRPDYVGALSHEAVLKMSGAALRCERVFVF